MKLIINADDFGMSRIFNDVILDLAKNKLISSTTVMVDRVKNMDDQFQRLKTYQLSIGLHLEFENNYENQMKRQYQKFVKLLGFPPSHVDIHKAHSREDSWPIVAEFCKKHNLPMRNSGTTFEGVKQPEKAFFGSIDDFSKIEDWITTCKEGKTYEILFHPGKYDPNCKSSLNKDRERDVEHIKKLNTRLKDIQLVGYGEL